MLLVMPLPKQNESCQINTKYLKYDVLLCNVLLVSPVTKTILTLAFLGYYIIVLFINPFVPN